MTIRPHETHRLSRYVRALRFARAGALMVLCLYPGTGHAYGEPASATPTDGQAFTIPQRPLHLSRILIRYLSDGEKLVITRRWEVRFTPQAEETIVTGTPLSVQVDVPAYLQELGEIEKRRISAGPFPITLDLSGRVIGQSADSDDDTTASAAMRARSLMNRGKGAEQSNANGFDFLSSKEFTSAAPQSAIQPDMFLANPAPVDETTSFLIDDGTQGSFTKNCRKIPAERGSYPYDYACDITTQLGEVTATTREIWRFEVPGE